MTTSKKLIRMLFIMTLFALAPSSYAQAAEGIYLGLHLNYQTSKGDYNGASGSDVKSTTADFLLGSRGAGGLYWGGIYTTVGDDLTVTAQTTNQRSSALGLSVGYFPEQFFVMGHYFFQGEYGSGASKYNKGSGIGVDVGYVFNIASSFSLGGGMAYRSIEYKDNSSNTFKLTTFSPRLIFSFLF